MTDTDHAMTLDPPGTIAVVGAGPLGIEAALYGRFLGYDVSLLEAVSVGHSLKSLGDQPLPMLPDRCLSPLALAALEAQGRDTSSRILPLTCGEWIERALIPLTESDLLAGRLRVPARVIRISQIPAGSDDAEAGEPQEEATAVDDESVPEDFRLHLESGESVDAEAVVLAIGNHDTIDLEVIRKPSPGESIPYFFRCGSVRSDNAEQDLATGRSEIVRIFAELAGRPQLDLYRPPRS